MVSNQRDLFVEQTEKETKYLTKEVPLKKVFDFVRMERENSMPINKSAEIVDRLAEFDPKSRQVQNYNEELRLQLALQGEHFEKQFNFILDCMSKNGVVPDLQTNALLFSKSLVDQELE
jgi:hypothetical protein